MSNKGDLQAVLRHGDAILQMMQVTGEEGITEEDFITYQKSLFLDMVYLQQDAFDKVDASAPLERQKLCFNKVYDLVKRDYSFTDKNAARDYFIRLTGLFKNFNYAAPNTPDYESLLRQIDEHADAVS